MTRRLIAIAIAIVSVLAFAAPSMGARSRVKATGDSPANFRWDPATGHISKGDKVVWRNPTGATHTVTAYSSNWEKNSTVASGDTTSKIFRRNGAYKYRCTRPGHSSVSGGRCTGMCGVVHVM